MERHTIFDWSRKARTGIPEAVFAEGKALSHLHDVIREHIDRNAPLLITRLTPAQIDGLRDLPLSVDDLARTATLDAPEPDHDAPVVAIVTAGTSDLSVAREAEVAANFMGLRTELIADVGVAGLWRLEAHLPALCAGRGLCEYRQRIRCSRRSGQDFEHRSGAININFFNYLNARNSEFLKKIDVHHSSDDLGAGERYAATDDS